MSERIRPRIPPPSDPAGSPRVLVAELAGHLGTATCVDECVALLRGDDPAGHAAVLPFLGGRPGAAFLSGTWGPPYWARVWGARGLLYVWADSAAPAVLRGLADPQWRVAEMCLKVAAARDVAGAGDDAARLASHRLDRVRAAALRALAVVGDTEHVGPVVRALDDPSPQVRGAAVRCREAMSDRLDITVNLTASADAWPDPPGL